MSGTDFNTQNDTYRKLIGNGLSYRVPRFQRDYSWDEEQWEDLWADILDTTKEGGEPVHYMGYLVLQSDNKKMFDVIDGQQRLTTLTIIVLAVLKNIQRLIDSGIHPEQNKLRIDQLRNTYIGYLDPVTLISKTKLTLNRNNDNYFQTYLVPLSVLPKYKIRASEHSLRKSFEWFDKSVEEFVKKIDTDKGAALANLIDVMSDRFFFTVISVTDELNAYKVFETLNARGVRLSSTDLLKNYLFSVLHKDNQSVQELQVLEDRWERIVSTLGSESFPDFLRVSWTSRHNFVRQAELFKIIRTKINTRAHVFELLRNLDEDVDTYGALTDPESSNWIPCIKEHVRTLRLFKIRQPNALLVAAKRLMNDQDFESIIKACVVISYRYNVIGGLHTNDQERVYYNVAEKISSGKFTKIQEILDAMRLIYPSDDAFKTAFVDKVLRTTDTRNNRIVRYTLLAIEKQFSGKDFESESDSYNIEHIFPQNPTQTWLNFSDADAEAMTYRLGNMTLMGKSDNRDVSNSLFNDKKTIYEKSVLDITKSISADYNEWTPQSIIARQKWMAKQATAIWRIAQLS